MNEVNYKITSKIKYNTSLLFVHNVNTSKNFYCSLLDQEIDLDLGSCITFKAGFSIMNVEYIYEIVFSEKFNKEEQIGKKNFELYFESEEIEEVFKKLKKVNVDFVHDLREQPWGQKVFRIYDPDKHVIEIGEPISATVIRLNKQGMNIEQIVQKTSLSKEIIQNMLKNK